MSCKLSDFFSVSLPPQFWLDTDQVLIMPHSPFHPLFPTPYDSVGFSKFWEWGQRERSETESVLLDWYNWSTGIGALWVSLNGQILIFFYESFVDLFGDHMHTCIYVHRLSHISWDFLLGPPSICAASFGCLLMTSYLTSGSLLPQILFAEFTLPCRCSSQPESRTTQVFSEVSSYQGNQSSSCLIKLWRYRLFLEWVVLRGHQLSSSVNACKGPACYFR